MSRILDPRIPPFKSSGSVSFEQPENLAKDHFHLKKKRKNSSCFGSADLIRATGRLGNNHKDFSKKIDNNYLNDLLNKYIDEGDFEINEIDRNSLDTKKKDKIYYVEISIELIPKSFFKNLSVNKKAINFVTYKPVSEYPSSTRDFSFSIDKLDKVNIVIALLDSISDDIVKDSFIFDFYKNEKTEIVKLGYRCIFQSNLKTLSDLDINKKVQEILSPILKLDGVSIPGM